MRFVQTIEFRTSRIDEMNRLMDDWLASTEGSRIPTRGQLTRDRDQADTSPPPRNFDAVVAFRPMVRVSG